MNRALMIASVCLAVAFVLFLHGLKPRAALPMAKAKRTLPPMMVTLKSGKHLSLNQLWPHHLSLVHVWASWCPTCQVDHQAYRQRAANLPKGIQLIGLDFQDDPKASRAFIARYGNPYRYIIDDQEGQVALALGVTGAPELYLVNAHGQVIERWIGIIRDDRWADIIKRLKVAS